MVVGVGIIDIFIVNGRSLKEKRGVLRRVIQRTRNKFNISIAEIGDQDSWKSGKIGFTVVGNDGRFVNSMMDTVMHFIEELNLVHVVNSKIEIMSLSDAMDDGCGYTDDKFLEL
ncbi:MAG: DUF503 domain-containing protein [Deltaproteobacteria bacterium]|nr:DUF503 domain-containing protein [Deltaproteobacteria bacterium]MBN2687120.1 DUF503 domain-containing protein [Deltaproteobacteria bacterium]